MAAADALDAQPCAFQSTVFLDGFERILGAGRGEPACRRCERRDESLIEANE